MLTNRTCWLQKAALCGRVVSQQCAATGAGMGGMRCLGMGRDAQWGVLSPILAVGMLCPKPLLSVPCLCQPGGCSLLVVFLLQDRARPVLAVQGFEERGT